MAVSDYFVWGNGGAKLTPEELARQREIEDRLVQQGVDTSPVGHWSQGLARVANALAGAVRRGQLGKAEKENKAYNADQVKSWFGGSDFPAAPSAGTGAVLPASDAGQQIGATSPAPDVSKNGDTFAPFIDTIKAGGLTNPYGLAAVAATGRAESGWSPQNAARSWSDPSESGQAGSAGGILSWRAERLANLQKYAASKGEQGNGSPRTQAEYFMREDPALVAKLNAAKSPEEAQSLMNNAWKFAGYNRPGGEAARRLGYATAYLPQFQGGAEVASLDPAAGMPPAAAAIEAQAPRAPAPYRDPMIVQSPEASALAAREAQGPQAAAAPPLPPPVTVSSPPQVAGPQTPDPQLVAQAVRARGGNPNAGILPVITGEQGQTGMTSSGPNMQTLMGAMSDPRLSEGNRRIAEILIRQQMEREQAARELAAQQAAKQAEWAREDARYKVTDEREAARDAYTRQKDERGYNFDREKWEAEQGKGVVVDGKLVNPTKGNVIYAPQGGNFDDVSGLRKEIQQLPSYKNLAQAGPIYKSMAETAGRNSKASDLNLVYGLGKIMDPNSVVREGEMVMVKNTASIPDWLQGAIAQINGGAALTPETRQAIMREAYGRVQGYKGAFDQDMGMYGGIVQRNGMNPADVIPSFGSFEEWKAPEAATTNGPARIKTVDDYNALPSGAQYVDPKGRLKTKE